MIGDDFDFSSMSGSGDSGVRVDISHHAAKQWRDRVPDRLHGKYPLNTRTWKQAELVMAPSADCDEARLVAIRGERDMLLCAHHHPDATVVATALYADHDRLRRL